MRTKTLLITAALSAAGLATSMAQVYSVNIVGYVNLSIPPGFSMIANQLNASPDNTIVNLLPAPPNGTFVFKFNPATGGYTQDDFQDGAWEGDDLTLTMNPGEGVFISNPQATAFTATFVGEVQLNSSIPIPPGFSIVSSPIPQAGALDTDLGFTPINGEFTYQFNPATGGYIQNDYQDGAWEGDGNGASPALAVGEAFFVSNPNAASTWNRTFSVGP